MRFSDYKLIDAGDTALVVQFGETIDLGVSEKIIELVSRLENANIAGIVEIVPSFRSVMIHYEPLVLASSVLKQRILELQRDLRPSPSSGREWRLPVCYDLEVAPDLEEVAMRTGLTIGEVVKLHSSATYHVYMLGFMPGFSYLGDVPQRLQLPRRATPRSSVPAGSLAIAMQMTSIYPLSSPGGWHLIGECPVPFFRLTPNPATLLFPGDKVKFESVTLAEHRSLLERATRGSLQIHPVVIQDNRAA